jgi:hypothetical protein
VTHINGAKKWRVKHANTNQLLKKLRFLTYASYNRDGFLVQQKVRLSSACRRRIRESSKKHDLLHERKENHRHFTSLGITMSPISSSALILVALTTAAAVSLLTGPNDRSTDRKTSSDSRDSVRRRKEAELQRQHQEEQER